MGLFRSWLEGMTATTLNSLGPQMRDFRADRHLVPVRPEITRPLPWSPGKKRYECKKCRKHWSFPRVCGEDLPCPICGSKLEAH